MTARPNVTRLPALAAGASVIQSLKVTASSPSGTMLVATPSPEGQLSGNPALCDYAVIRIKQRSAAACSLSIGTAADGVTPSANLIDTLSVATAPANTVYSNRTNPGSAGKEEVYVAPTDSFNVYVQSGNANGLQADVLYYSRLLSGGPVYQGD